MKAVIQLLEISNSPTLIVPAHDKEAAARFFADSFDLEVGRKSPGSGTGLFVVVRVGEINLDFDDMQTFEPHHYAFHVSDEDFDLIFGRVKARSMTYAADPVYRHPGEINSNEG